MKISIFILVCLFLLECSLPESENTRHDENISQNEQVITQTKDALVQKSDSDISASFPLTTEIIIYTFYEAQLVYNSENHEPVKKIRFVPLTDSYRWSDHPDSLAITNEFLGDTLFEHDNFHELDDEHRSRFLERSDLRESDKIFVYNILLDSLLTYDVKDIPIVAMLTPYGTQGAARQYDYLIGFELANCTLLEGYFNSLVYVGEVNPFNKASLVPISWKEIAAENFPSFQLNKEDSIAYHRYHPQQPLKTYYFEKNGLEYFVQNLGRGGGVSTRHLVVVDSNTEGVIFNGIYNDSEGTYLLSLNGIEEAHYGTNINQWTGPLFKDRPPVVFGFLGFSFGCPSINFLDDSREPIYIRCDNRH